MSLRVDKRPSGAHVPSASDRARRRRAVVVLGVASVVVPVVLVLLPRGLFQSFSGAVNLARIVESFTGNVGYLLATLTGDPSAGIYSTIVCNYISAFLSGAALGACGAVLQGAFRNPLASPSTLGVVSGCLLGAVVYSVFLHTDQAWVSGLSVSELTAAFSNMNPLEYLWVVYGKAFCATVGGLAVVLVALFVARKMGGGSLNNIVLVVIGQVFALVIGSVCDVMRYYFERSGDYAKDELVQMAQAVPFSAFSGFSDLALFAVPLIVGVIVLLIVRSRVNLLAFSDEEARSLGLDVGRFRPAIVALCALITGLVVGWCGPVAFVGFVCPHVARRLVGSDYRYLLPASVFAGALFVPIVLFVVNQFDIDMYQGFNLIASAIGCIVFLVIAYRNRGGAHAWR